MSRQGSDNDPADTAECHTSPPAARCAAPDHTPSRPCSGKSPTVRNSCSYRTPPSPGRDTTMSTDFPNNPDARPAWALCRAGNSRELAPAIHSDWEPPQHGKADADHGNDRPFRDPDRSKAAIHTAVPQPYESSDPAPNRRSRTQASSRLANTRSPISSHAARNKPAGISRTSWSPEPLHSDDHGTQVPPRDTRTPRGKDPALQPSAAAPEESDTSE